MLWPTGIFRADIVFSMFASVSIASAMCACLALEAVNFEPFTLCTCNESYRIALRPCQKCYDQLKAAGYASHQNQRTADEFTESHPLWIKILSAVVSAGCFYRGLDRALSAGRFEA